MMRKNTTLAVAALIGATGLAGLQMVGASAAVTGPSHLSPGRAAPAGSGSYVIYVDGGGSTPAAAEANAQAQIPDNCTRGTVTFGPSFVDGEWVVTERARCVNTG